MCILIGKNGLGSISSLAGVIASVSLLLAVFFTSSEAAETKTNLVIEVTGEATAIFKYTRDACAEWDVPDNPARAFRDSTGTVHLLASHHHVRDMKGTSYSNVHRDCRVIYQGKESKDPADFNDRGWLSSVYTQDGTHIYGIVHNEYQSNRWPEICPSRSYLQCWYNSLSSVSSDNLGSSFHLDGREPLASIPFKAIETQGHFAGVFAPTNIVRSGGYFYFMANVVSPPPQAWGNCLFRTASLGSSAAWRMFRAGVFETSPANPYEGDIIITDHLCDPISKSALPWPVTSITQHESSGIWIALMMGGRTVPDGSFKTGIYYATSADLIEWRGPEKLVEMPMINHHDCKKENPVDYPSLIDPNSSDRNFQTTSDTAQISFTSINELNCVLGPNRDLLSFPVFIKIRQ